MVGYIERVLYLTPNALSSVVLNKRVRIVLDDSFYTPNGCKELFDGDRVLGIVSIIEFFSGFFPGVDINRGRNIAEDIVFIPKTIFGIHPDQQAEPVSLHYQMFTL